MKTFPKKIQCLELNSTVAEDYLEEDEEDDWDTFLKKFYI